MVIMIWHINTTRKYVCVQMRSHTHTQTHTHTRVHKHTLTHTRTHTHTHTLTHSHTHTSQRVTSADHIAEHWYDYGVFCLLVSDMDRCEQCLKEAVSLDQTLVPAYVGSTCKHVLLHVQYYCLVYLRMCNTCVIKYILLLT